uniref:Cytochrome P450 n=1 Tax=Panagrellus redivivus TaxID=6233 RepID=A0A7E4VSH0_PANRE
MCDVYGWSIRQLRKMLVRLRIVAPAAPIELIPFSELPYGFKMRLVQLIPRDDLPNFHDTSPEAANMTELHYGYIPVDLQSLGRFKNRTYTCR